MTAEWPSNWGAATVGSFCKLVNGRPFRPSEWSKTGLPIIRIQNLRDAAASFNRFDGTPQERHLVQAGDLLFAWSGTPGTSFGAHVWTGEPGVLNQHIYKLVFDDAVADPWFLRLALNAQLPLLVAQARGGAGLKHLNKSMIEAIKVPLPPRPEQVRILEALKASSGRLEGLTAEMEVLTAAVPALERQLLTAVMSDSPVEAEDKASVARRDRAATLPAVWDSAAVEDVGDVLIGRQRSPRNHFGPNMRPYLRVANVLDDRIDTSDVMAMNFGDAEFQRYHLQDGDILLNEGQSLEYIGRAAMFRGEMENVCFTNTLIRFRSGPRVHPHYAMLVFRHYQRSGRFREIAKITTNLAHLGTKRFARLSFPLPPLTEQVRIANLVRSGIDRLRAIAIAVEQLRQDAKSVIGSIELSALSGHLSEQRNHEKAPRPVHKTSCAVSTPVASAGSRERRVMEPISVAKALADAERALGPQELFQAAGYPEDATVQQVERFFMDLRTALASGEIHREMREGEEMFFAAGEPK